MSSPSSLCSSANVVVVVASSRSEKKKGVSLGHLVSGGAAGALSRTLTAPLDRLKVLYEVKHVKTRTNSIWRDLKAIGERGGFRSYFRGNGVNVVKIIPKMAIKFYAFEFFKNQICPTGDPTVAQRLAAGMSAAAFSQFFIHPLDCVKTRIAATEEAAFRGVSDVVRAMVKEGPLAFYRGVIPSVVGIIPSMGVDLAIYDSLKALYARQFNLPPKENAPATALLAIGMISTAAGYTVGQPFGVIRARLMVQGSHAEFAQRYSGAIDVVVQTVREDGIRGMYRGLGPQMLRVIPAGSITYVAYDKFQEWWNRLYGA
eukprot:c10309_g2_i1.p1 GENE.c10309_g2_i1~~c10309_g2_i1.p1  ORF type:complete len:315 (-),score=49.07 c10309_g2_i1:189-1133(-)